jgi:2-polyprenyl-3-methyl-5-hydroxy-6-metoxy-1,4-benzoquinol methylase
MPKLPKIQNIRIRSEESEILDEKQLPPEELDVIYENINKVNSYLGGNSSTIKVLKRLLKNNSKEEVLIVDVGSGGGGMCRKIADVLEKKQINYKIIGVDINEDSLIVARKRSIDYSKISFHNINVFSKEFKELKADIIVSTLTFHHLTNQEIMQLLDNCLSIDQTSIIINDLHRSKVAFHLFRMVSFIFSMHFINRYDGLISILRSFKKADLLALNKLLKTKHPNIETSIKWKWAFRWIWTIKKV